MPARHAHAAIRMRLIKLEGHILAYSRPNSTVHWALPLAIALPLMDVDDVAGMNHGLRQANQMVSRFLQIERRASTASISFCDTTN